MIKRWDEERAYPHIPSADEDPRASAGRASGGSRRGLTQDLKMTGCLISIFQHKPLRRFRQRQPPESRFDGNLPGGYGAQIDLIVRVDNSPRAFSESSGASAIIQRKVRVSRRSFTAYRHGRSLLYQGGSGSKNSGGIRNVPFASPMGRFFFLPGEIGRISATGTFLLHSSIDSPFATRAKWRERCVLAS